jgi:WD40 repeat protein
LHTQKYLRSLNQGELASSVAWSPDGSKLAVGSTKDYGTPFYQGGDSSNSNKAHLTVWDTSTWEILFEPAFSLEMVNAMFRDLAWSANNRLLAFSLDLGGVQVWDTQGGHLISRQENFAGTVVDISWSPDGSRLVATGDMAYGIRRWRVSDNRAVRLFDKRISNSMQVAWSPDGKRIASGHVLGTVCLWTAATNRCDGFIQAHRTATFSLAWSPDSSRLATGGGLIRVWDTNTGKLIGAFGQDDRYIYTKLEWPAIDQPIVTLQTGLEDPGDTILRLWDIESASILMEWRGRQQAE